MLDHPGPIPFAPDADADPGPPEEPADLHAALRDLTVQLDAQTEAVADLTRARALDAALIRAGIVDLDAGRLLAEADLADAEVGADGAPDVAATIARLTAQRPYLFARRAAAASGALAARPAAPAGPSADLCTAAAHAQDSGRRQDLLAYLRLRRRTPAHV